MKNTKISLIAAMVITLTGCGGGDSSSSSTSNNTTDVEVERGKVYDSTVKDATGKIAVQKGNTNIYTFSGDVTYPITATGGWIDLNNDGVMDDTDIELTIPMKSYSNVITPVTTYIADPSETNRLNKLQSLKESIIEVTGDEFSNEELLKVPSKSGRETILAVNSLYAEMVKNNDTETINMLEVKNRINDFDMLAYDSDLTPLEMAEYYENKLVFESDLGYKFEDYKLSEYDKAKYQTKLIDIEKIDKKSQAVVVINNVPPASIPEIEHSLSLNYDEGVTLYRVSNDSLNCETDFGGFSVCNEFDVESYGFNTYEGEKLTLVGIYGIPDYVDDTSNSSITQIVGKTFYTLDIEKTYEPSYSVFSIGGLTAEDLNSDNGIDKDYVLENGEWVEVVYEEDTEEDVYKATVIGDKLKIIEMYKDENGGDIIDTIYISIAEQNSEYWTMKFDYSTNYGEGYNNVFYKKWYLKPTAEILDPSLVMTETIYKSSRTLNKEVDDKFKERFEKILKKIKQ